MEHVEVVVIPSYKGDNVLRIGKLVGIYRPKGKGTKPFVRVQYGHEGASTKAIYRSYHFSDLDKGIKADGLDIGEPVE
jgi:hypothetical protein